MFTGHRAMASTAFFGSMIGTIYAAMGLRIYLLVILFIGPPPPPLPPNHPQLCAPDPCQ